MRVIAGWLRELGLQLLAWSYAIEIAANDRDAADELIDCSRVASRWIHTETKGRG